MKPLALLLLAGLATPAFAQWSTDPAANLIIADRSGEQTQPKIAARSDGGCYIAWFDNSTGGYDVYLQRLSPAGVEQWPHNGILVADRSVSSTVDYDLAVDADGNALLIYNDDSVIPGTQQIQLQKISQSGQPLFGPQGITVSDGGSAFKANPHVAVLGNGSIAAGYTSNNTIFLQRYTAAGAPLWPSPVAISELYQAPSTLHNISLSDLQSGGVDAVIALYVRSRTSSFLSNKSLYAQKFSAAGTPVWTGTGASTGAGNPVIVFDAGTTTGIQNGYFPTFLPFEGGGIFAWYETGGERHAYFQHILASGAPKFPAPVASTGPTPGRIRLGASVSFGPPDESYYLAAPEGPSSTTIADSLHVQRFSVTGERQWGNSGIYAISPDPANQPTNVHCFAQSAHICRVLCINPSASSSSQVIFTALDPQGAISASVAIATAAGTKSRLAAASSNTSTLAAFVQGDTASSDILAQNVSSSGVLGPPPCYPNCDLSTSPPILNVADFSCFLMKFAQQDPYADCDPAGPPNFNVADFSCFLTKFAAGCP